ncbi:MAG: hypothetical protein ACT4N2_09790 [Hyphomicrobium sp.]
MKTIIKAAIAALSLAAGASASQAEIVWHFPYKGAPYATRTEPTQQVVPYRMLRNGKHVQMRTARKAHVIR